MQPDGSDSPQQEQNQQPQQTPPQLHQQWMAMQYPPPTMIMQPHMMPHSHYRPPLHPMMPQYFPAYPQFHHPHGLQFVPQQYQNHAHGWSTKNRTIWVGDLHHWMDETYLHSCFSSAGEISSLKVIRNKHTSQSEGYGFVEFLRHDAAVKVLQNYIGLLMPNTDQPFHLNWATFSANDRRSDNTPDLSIFVGDLAPDVTDNLLCETFASRYPSVRSAKVVLDASTGRSKGYGFVRFGDESEKAKAMTEMNGMLCSARPMRIGAATPRKSSGYQQQGGCASNGASNRGLLHAEGDSANTTIFVGGLDPSVTDEELKQPFSPYGDIVSVKIPVGKGCGFIQFANRNNAEEALQKLNGVVIGKQVVRLSWGRHPANKQFRADSGKQWSGGSYMGQVYDGYGYPFSPLHDPNVYAAAAAAYGAYPVYESPQQQVN